MSNARIIIQWQYKFVCLLIGTILLSCSVQAQLSLKRQKYDSIAARHRNEHAIYTDVICKLVVKEENNEVVATSTGSMEKLFISDKSLNKFNQDDIYGRTYSYFTNIDAVSYVPDGNDYRIVKNRDKDGDIALNYTGIKRGTITRTTYSMVFEELRLLPSFFFANDVPTLNSVFEVVAPKFVKMGFLLKGEDTSMIKRTVKESGGNIIYRFTATKVPAHKEYNGVPSPMYYTPHVIPYVVSFRLAGAKKDSVLAGNMDVHCNYEHRYVKGLNLKTDSFLNKKVAELTRNSYSDRDKVQRIYDWVQKSFHYEALYLDDREGFVPNAADTVMKRMYGDCKDMSSILYAMCTKAGVPAYFAVVGTDDKPYTHDELQSQYLYDHMVCAVKLDGEWVFLDGTTHVQPLGVDRPDLQDKEVMIMLDDNHHKLVKIPELSASRNAYTDNTVMNISNTDVYGNTYQHFSGYMAWDIAEALSRYNRKEDKDELVKTLAARGNSKFLVKSYNISAESSGNKDASLSTNYTIGGYVQQLKRELFVNMNMRKTLADIRVNDSARNVPMYLRYKRTIKETVTLNVPKGYRVSYVPKAAKGGLDGILTYSIRYKSDAASHTVTLTREYEVKAMKIDPSQFAASNKLVDELNNLYKETVVLTAK